jgi:hypothetical protein
MRRVGVHVVVNGEKGAVMRWMGVHIETKRERGLLRDGGASKENMCFFSVEGSTGSEGSKCLYSGRVLGS